MTEWRPLTGTDWLVSVRRLDRSKRWWSVQLNIDGIVSAHVVVAKGEASAIKAAVKDLKDR